MLKNQVVLVSIILTISLLGDATLYVALPLYHDSYMLTLFWVGIVLSANRFSRLFFNPVAAKLISNFGIKKLLIFATSLAALSTLSYGLSFSVIYMIFFRILWGFAYAIIRLAVLTVIANEKNKTGHNLGLYHSIQEICPILIILFLSFYIEKIDLDLFYFYLSLITCFAVYLSTCINDLKARNSLSFGFFPKLKNEYLFMFTLALFSEGVFLVSVGLVFHTNGYSQNESMIYLSLLIILKRLLNLFFSTSFGRIYDRFAVNKLIFINTLVLVSGIILLLTLEIWFGSILILFSFNFLNAGISVYVLNRSKSIKEISDLSTWRDLAAAIGVFIGASFFDLIDYKIIYISFAFIFIIYAMKWYNGAEKIKVSL